MKLKALLLDLDGTLLHTAPDMVNALNILLQSHQKPEAEFDRAMRCVSRGAAAMIQVGFGKTAEDSDFETLKQEFLDIYAQNICIGTQPFEGMLDVLDYCENNSILWGIVTNKMERLTTPILQQLNLDKRSSITVCGDTLSVNKPHPAPLLHCTTLLHLAPSNCLYVGDDVRDIQAGTAAGMHTAAANWGYFDKDTDVADWQPDFITNSPAGLLRLIQEHH
ncbi:MAG: HAD-IA family hydrolase [Arenicella sp.]